MLAALQRKFKKLGRIILGRRTKADEDAFGLEDVIDMVNYPKGYKHYAEVHWNALINYTPKFYQGKLTLLATTGSRTIGNPEAIWKSLSREMELRNIPATHEQMLEEPYVEIVAAELRDCLERCRNEEIKICAA